MRLIRFLILGLVALLGFSFALLNAQQVHIDYYVGTRDLPLSLLLVVAFVAGILLGLCLILPSNWRLKFELRRLHHWDE